MDAEAIQRKLNRKYPDRKIIKIPPENPKEIICEVEPTSDHSNHSIAIAVIDESAPHIHYQSREIYSVLEGEVELSVDGELHLMKPGHVYTIPPGKVHWAKGNSSMVEVISNPGWTPQDHILVEKKGGE